MTNLMPISVLTALATMSTAGAAAQPLPNAFDTQDCPEPSVFRWCASQAKRSGWTVTHRDQSPADLMDVSWLYELWQRDRAVVLCMYSGGRGGDRVNLCRALDEVR